MEFFKLNDQSNETKNVLNMSQVDQMIRKTIQFLWLVVPPENRTIDDVEKCFDAMVRRAFQTLRADSEWLEEGPGSQKMTED